MRYLSIWNLLNVWAFLLLLTKVEGIFYKVNSLEHIRHGINILSTYTKLALPNLNKPPNCIISRHYHKWGYSWFLGDRKSYNWLKNKGRFFVNADV